MSDVFFNPSSRQLIVVHGEHALGAWLTLEDDPASRADYYLQKLAENPDSLGCCLKMEPVPPAGTQKGDVEGQNVTDFGDNNPPKQDGLPQ